MKDTQRAPPESADSVLEAQVAALLQRLERNREQRCREIREAASVRAAELEHEAWHEAAARGRAAVADARARLNAGRSQSQAMLDAARRQRSQAQARARLDELWRRLPRVLEDLWTSAEARTRWIEAALTLADRALIGRHWTITHEADLQTEEITRALAALEFNGHVEVSFDQEPDIRAGLRIHSEGARLDTTPAGLLADEREIEAGFLAACDSLDPDACGLLPRHADD
ncbi:MAG TPA: hypothetical protein VLT59_13630 [Steroidobacteraceae bacterium]|nr:hypothetical protein [Steroidobacteraceae bacterium]